MLRQVKVIMGPTQKRKDAGSLVVFYNFAYWQVLGATTPCSSAIKITVGLAPTLYHSIKQVLGVLRGPAKRLILIPSEYT